MMIYFSENFNTVPQLFAMSHLLTLCLNVWVFPVCLPLNKIILNLYREMKCSFTKQIKVWVVIQSIHKDNHLKQHYICLCSIINLCKKLEQTPTLICHVVCLCSLSPALTVAGTPERNPNHCIISSWERNHSSPATRLGDINVSPCYLNFWRPDNLFSQTDATIVIDFVT